jgi:hypothetical protein
MNSYDLLLTKIDRSGDDRKVLIHLFRGDQLVSPNNEAVDAATAKINAAPPEIRNDYGDRAFESAEGLAIIDVRMTNTMPRMRVRLADQNERGPNYATQDIGIRFRGCGDTTPRRVGFGHDQRRDDARFTGIEAEPVDYPLGRPICDKACEQLACFLEKFICDIDMG